MVHIWIIFSHFIELFINFYYFSLKFFSDSNHCPFSIFLVKINNIGNDSVHQSKLTRVSHSSAHVAICSKCHIIFHYSIILYSILILLHFTPFKSVEIIAFERKYEHWTIVPHERAQLSILIHYLLPLRSYNGIRVAPLFNRVFATARRLPNYNTLTQIDLNEVYFWANWERTLLPDNSHTQRAGAVLSGGRRWTCADIITQPKQPK